MKSLEDITRKVMAEARNDNQGYNQAFVKVLILIQDFAQANLYEGISAAFDEMKKIHKLKNKS